MCLLTHSTDNEEFHTDVCRRAHRVEKNLGLTHVHTLLNEVNDFHLPLRIYKFKEYLTLKLVKYTQVQT